MVSFLSEEKASVSITEKNRQLLKSEVGARAIMQLVEWYNQQRQEAIDFKQQLIDILVEQSDLKLICLDYVCS